MNLVPILHSGKVAGSISLPETPRSVILQTVQMYSRRGYIEPWIGYLAAEGGAWVGSCSFTAPPSRGMVEIAYFTFPEFEGRGVATKMAQRLIAIARENDSSLDIMAYTLPAENASNHILKKLGFEFSGAVNHPEDGKIWEWRHTRAM